MNDKLFSKYEQNGRKGSEEAALELEWPDFSWDEKACRHDAILHCIIQPQFHSLYAWDSGQ